MKRKILSILIVLVLVFSLLPISAMASYSDVEDHWAKAAIDKWSDLGILEGSDGKFRPEDPITRGDMAIIIDRIMQFTTAADNTFTDLGEEYYTDAVLKCNEAGIITGDSGLVRPTDNITREEAVVMLGRALGLTESGASSGFDDSASISSWALGYVNAMAAKGYVHGTDDLFNPKSSIKRGEIVTILDNAITKIYNEAAEYTGDVEGIAIVNTTGVTLSDMTINGDLIIAEGVDDGDVTLNNVTVTGNTIVRGGGANSIHIEGNSNLKNIIIEKTDDGQIRIVTEDGSVVDAVFVDDGNDDIILTGTFGSVTVAAGVTVKAVGATVELVDITDDDGQFIIDEDSVIDTLILDAAATVTNNGKITKAEVNVEGSTIDGNEPEDILYAEGVAGAKDTDTTTGGGGGGGGGSVTPSISVTSLITSDASTVSFSSSVADATIIWNGTTLTTKTTSGTNTITVPLMESGTSNTLKIIKSGYVAYSGTVTWVEPYDTNATLGTWVQDRTDPLEWTIDGDNWITMTNNIDPSNTWYGWNGKTADTGMGLTTDWIVETQFEITSDMLAKDDVRASIWLAVDGIENFRANGWGGTIDWTILQFRKNSTTGTTTWQWWDSYYENDPTDPTDVGAWFDITAPIPTEAGVYYITITCINGLIKQYINGIFVNQYDIVGVTDDLTAPTDVFIQSYSFGEEYTIKAKVPTVRYLYMYPADAVHNNEVSGQITNDDTGKVDGYLSYVGTNDLHIEGQLTPVSGDAFLYDFSGKVSGAFSGDITAQMQINGNDTMFGEITGTSASEKVWIRGVFLKSGTPGDFEGEIIVGDNPICVTGMTVTAENSYVAVGDTQQMVATVTTSNASDQDVLWSVWSASNSDNIATIDEDTGLLTAVGPGTVTVIAKALDGSLMDASKSITVAPVVNQTQDAGYDTIQAAIDDATTGTGDTILFASDFSGLDERILINKSITLDGNGHTLTFTSALNSATYGTRHGILINTNDVTVKNLTVVTDAITSAWEGVYPIQVYDTTNVILDSVTTMGGDRGILINGSTATLMGTIDVSGNEYSGIEVSKNSSLSDSNLTINATLINNDEAYTNPTIVLVREKDSPKEPQGSVTGTNVPAYINYYDGHNDEYQENYYLNESSLAVNLVSVTPAQGFVDVLDGPFVMTITADAVSNLTELEVDHNLSTLPEFSVYAVEGDDAYGSDKAQFESAGVTVTYDASAMQWVITFESNGYALNEIKDAGGITFYFVLKDDINFNYGTMYGTTADNTFDFEIANG